MIEFLSNIDTQIFLAINHFNAPWLDQFMMLVSHRFVWIPLYVAIFAVLIIRFGWRIAIALALGVALAVALADQMCATMIRPYVERMRPANPDNPLSPLVHIVNGYRGGRYGFPSCHAANTFALATFISVLFRLRRPIVVTLYGWALFNCWSRIYLGVHYPGDLLVGAAVGTLCGMTVCLLQAWVIRRLMRRSALEPAAPAAPLRITSTAVSPEIRLDLTLMSTYVGVTTLFILLGVSLVGYML